MRFSGNCYLRYVFLELPFDFHTGFVGVTVLGRTDANAQEITDPYQQRCTELQNKLQEQEKKFYELEKKFYGLEKKLYQQERSGVEKFRFAITVLSMQQFEARSSISRAKAWTGAIKHPNSKGNVSLPASRFIPNSHMDKRQLEERLVKELGKHARPEERTSTIRYFPALSTSALGDVHVLDTHRQRFLDDLDLDVVLQRSSKSIDKFNIAAVLDLKGIGDDGHAKLNTANNLGQILDYLTAMEYCQPAFSKAAVAEQVEISPTYTSKLTQYRKVPLCDALRYLYEQLQDATANPPQLPFSESAGELSYIVQCHSKSVVAVFYHQNAQIIVKASPAVEWNSGIQNEIIFLKSLQGDSRPASIPKLIYDTYEVPGSAFVEFGISPPGRPLQLELFREASDFRTCLQDIFVALKWVHDHGIVHRDPRGQCHCV
ncbi:hypothetical protein L211DRAFT_870923 [Terfezia boudieri ATCC MYA-4762]|uniref:Protein kinase domain-containing protein n=1 Tax=Terfezia boudieri ATCC MYA-4762 TaxID=1051890 RepID=A0A3N4LH54_9PEZI|nr:hypothetical protein L211DRAFT_870923 [Terfezia boudieri ATCC MYA-4762]